MSRKTLKRTINSKGSKNKTLKTKQYSKKQIVDLCKKYGVTTSGSKKELANRLAAMRSVYMIQKDKRMILPFLSNNVNKKIFVKTFKNKAKKMHKIIGGTRKRRRGRRMLLLSRGSVDSIMIHDLLRYFFHS